VRYLSWIITIPVALVIVSFAVSNRGPVELALWPLPFQITVPIYVATLVALVLGFLAGGFIAWVSGGRYRAAARERRRRIAQLEQELAAERNQRMSAERRLSEAAQNLATGTVTALPAADASRRALPAAGGPLAKAS